MISLAALGNDLYSGKTSLPFIARRRLWYTIAVLVIAWTHLGASSRVHDEAKERARSAQEELDAAQSTLDDINRQIEEAQK